MRGVKTGIMAGMFILIFSSLASAESALGPPIGSVTVEFSPSNTVQPNERVNVTVKWWITDANFSDYEGPFNLHIALKDSSGNDVDSWTLHVCNYCCGNSSSSCSNSCNCSDSQCSCSNSCCDCLNASTCVCCGYVASETVPYEYEFSRLAPSEPGTYYLDVQIVASCLTEEVGRSGNSHTLLVASQEDQLTTVPEFPMIAIPAAVVIGLLLIMRRK